LSSPVYGSLHTEQNEPATLV